MNMEEPGKKKKKSNLFTKADKHDKFYTVYESFS